MSKAALGIGASILANEFVKRIGKETGENIIKQGINGAGDKVAEKAKDIFADSKEIRDKYKKMKKVIISTDANVETFKEALFEASNMQSYYRYEMDSINLKNPANMPKHKLNKNQYEKWKNLLESLRTEATLRINKEATIVYESKNKSDFFNPYSVINADLINCESKEDYNEILLKIHKYYLKDFSTDKDFL